MLKKLSRYYHTLKHLKFIQIRYQVWYRLRDRLFPVRFIHYKYENAANSKSIQFPYEHESFKDNEFSFLNIKHTFKDDINWNISDFGKLWVYNLNYFGFLNQESISKKEGLRLINDYNKKINQSKDGLEAYPISLRGLNWIKFLMRFEINDPNINSYLFSQYKVLEKKIEYNLLGNHLIENGFSLFVAGLYLKNHKLLKQGESIINKELKEQVLDDGGHFERSPMYHQIMFQRVLDCINISTVLGYEGICKGLLRAKAGLMLEWLEMLSFKDGSIPHFNDSTNDISLSSRSLISYAKELNVESTSNKLHSSGYRKFQNDSFELIIDGGGVKPDYQAAHSHNDAGSFVLNYNGVNYIVDTGISTYENNSRRFEERAVSSHNTVFRNGFEPSDIWGSFRVGKREKVEFIEENNSLVKIRRTIPNPSKYIIERDYLVENNRIIINDRVLSDEEHIFNLHFSEQLDIKTNINEILVGDLIISIDGHAKIESAFYYRALGYNHLVKSNLISIHFNKQLTTTIEIR